MKQFGQVTTGFGAPPMRSGIHEQGGVRYRRVGVFRSWDPWARDCQPGNAQGPNGTELKAVRWDTSMKREDDWVMYPVGCYPSGGTILEELPYIPNWPGCRPEQYISDDPNLILQDGDVIAYPHFGAYTIESVARTGCRLSVFAEGYAYLIERMDPTEDVQ